VILHPAENDETIAGRFDLVVEDLEAVAQPERSDLAFDQALLRFLLRVFVFGWRLLILAICRP
jgi:hypothetical protein